MAAIIYFPVSVVNVPLRNGRALVDSTFLHHHTRPKKFCSLDALVEGEGSVLERMAMEGVPNVSGDIGYILDATISCLYAVNAKDEDGETKTTKGKEPMEPCTPSASTSRFFESGTPTQLDTEVILLEGAITSQPRDPINISQVNKSTIRNIQSLEKPNTLSKELNQVKSIMQVLEMPKEYDGDIVLEFPPTHGIINAQNDMYLMEHKYDAHYWSKARTTTINYPARCRRSLCIGALTCLNEVCPQWVNHKQRNEIHFDGTLKNPPAQGDICNKEGKLRCHYCRQPPVCTATCNCYAIYVMPNDQTMTRILIHRGKHLHGVRKGMSKTLVDRATEMVRQVVTLKPNAGPKEVQVDVTKMIIEGTILHKGGAKNYIDETDFLAVLDEAAPIAQENWLAC